MFGYGKKKKKKGSYKDEGKKVKGAVSKRKKAMQEAMGELFEEGTQRSVKRGGK